MGRLAVAALGVIAATCVAGCSGAHHPQGGSAPRTSGTPSHAPGTGIGSVAPTDPFAACDAKGVYRGSQVEPSLAVSRRDPDTLLAAWQQDRRAAAGALGILAAVSTDGGGTWLPRALPGITTCAGGGYDYVSDPEAGIGAEGRMYVSSIAVGPPGQAILVSTSSDQGRTWGSPATVVRIPGDSVILDKPALLVDQRRSGTAYVSWVAYNHPPGLSISALRVDTAYVARTSDGGLHWSHPFRIYGSGTENQNHVLTQLGDGSILDVFAEGYRLSLPPGPQRVAATRSTDGGRTWSVPVTIGRVEYSVVMAPDGRQPVRASSQDVTAAAASNGLVVVAWEANQADHTEIAVAVSTDDGRHWQRLADPVDAGLVAFLPTVAVDSAGDLGLTWYRIAAGAGYPTSLDAAVLTSKATAWNERAITSPFPLDRAPRSPEGLFLGDYEGLVGQPCGFRALDAMVAGLTALVQTAEIPARC